MRRLLFIVLALLVAAPLIIVRSSADSAAEEERHCLATVIGQADDGEFILSEPICTTSGTAQDLIASHGVGEFTADGEVAAGARYAVLGIHFDGYNLSGSSFTVTGTTCGGGYTNVTGWWANRVNSTYAPGCTRVKHFDFSYLSGSYQSTWPTGNLSYMVNRTESIQYL